MVKGIALLEATVLLIAFLFKKFSLFKNDANCAADGNCGRDGASAAAFLSPRLSRVCPNAPYLCCHWHLLRLCAESCFCRGLLGWWQEDDSDSHIALTHR